MPVVIVAGALANKYRNGGEAWVRMSWARGLRRMGVDVYFVEQIAPDTCVDDVGAPADFTTCVNRDYFRRTVARFGFGGRAALLYDGGTACEGMTWDRVVDVAASA